MEGLIYVTALLIVSVISLFLGGVSWNRSDISGARWLAALLGSVSLWTSMQAASALSGSIGDKLFYHNLMYIGISLIPLSVLCFVLDYYHLLSTLTPSIRGALFAIPLMTICLVCTDPYHHLFYRSVGLQEVGGLTLIKGNFSMWFWVHSAYSYLLILGTLLVLGYQLRSESGPYRRQSIQLIGAILASSVINLLTISKIIDVSVDLTPFTFILVGAIFYYSLFYTRVFEIGPITKNLLYDNIQDALLILDGTGTVTEHNKAFLDLFDSTPDKIIGRNASELFDSLGYSGNQVMETLNTASRFRTEINHQPKNLQISRNSLKGRSASPFGTLYLLKDVTEIDRSLSAADAALKAAEVARESITRNLSDMSHEIRTPLMGILGAAHQLKADACDEEQLSDADEILAGAENLLGTVNRILDYSKLEAGKMSTHAETFTLESYLSELEALVQPVVLLEPSPSTTRTVSLKGDVHHLSQLIHLIHSFLRDSGTDEIRLSVSYDGKTLSHALRFHTVLHASQELLADWGNLGDYLMKPCYPDPLKLVLADKLAHFIGAPLSVQFLDQEWNLRFRLSLEEVSSAAPVENNDLPVEPDTPRKVLFAEDSLINQAVIRRMFKTLPWEITFASNGLQALEIAKASIFDGVFTDIHMPGLGGIELSYSLLETVNRDTPIFALTSDTDADLQEMIQQSPIRALVVKPCPREKLIRLLQENPRIVHDDDEYK